MAVHRNRSFIIFSNGPLKGFVSRFANGESHGIAQVVKPFLSCRRVKGNCQTSRRLSRREVMVLHSRAGKRVAMAVTVTVAMSMRMTMTVTIAVTVTVTMIVTVAVSTVLMSITRRRLCTFPCRVQRCMSRLTWTIPMLIVRSCSLLLMGLVPRKEPGRPKALAQTPLRVLWRWSRRRRGNSCGRRRKVTMVRSRLGLGLHRHRRSDLARLGRRWCRWQIDPAPIWR